MTLLCAVACALGVLTKGPIAVILVVSPLVAWRWLYPERSRAVSFRELLFFATAVITLNLPWYLMMTLRVPGFLKYFFWQHNVERFLNPFDHLQPIWYYGPILLGGLAPVSFLLWPAARAMFTGDPAAASRRSPELAFALVAGGFCVGFFSLSGCKLPTYILPAFPPLALALGVLLDDGPRLFRPSRWAGLGCWTLLLLLAHSVVIPAYATERSPLRDEEAVRAACGDLTVPVVCYPRNCDSVGFYLGRDDLKSTRSKNVDRLVGDLLSRPRTVVLFTHRHSLEALRYSLPKELTVTPVADFRSGDRGWFGDTPWGLCDIAVIERR